MVRKTSHCLMSLDLFLCSDIQSPQGGNHVHGINEADIPFSWAFVQQTVGERTIESNRKGWEEEEGVGKGLNESQAHPHLVEKVTVFPQLLYGQTAFLLEEPHLSA